MPGLCHHFALQWTERNGIDLFVFPEIHTNKALNTLSEFLLTCHRLLEGLTLSCQHCPKALVLRALHIKYACPQDSGKTTVTPITRVAQAAHLSCIAQMSETQERGAHLAQWLSCCLKHSLLECLDSSPNPLLIQLPATAQSGWAARLAQVLGIPASRRRPNWSSQV